MEMIANTKMSSHWRVLVLVAGMLCGFFGEANAAPVCRGKFFNPITDICWSCVLPLTLGGSKIMEMGQEGTSSYSGVPLCACANPPRIGAVIGFWEPARMAEVSRSNFCFHSLGGVKLDPGIDVPLHSQAQKKDGLQNQSFYQAHWYMSPLLFWLEVLLDDFCLEKGVFDLAYMTEMDPTWADSEWTFLLNPDVALFANPLAQATCAADCIASSAGFPLNTLYWCDGCAGPMYPLTGWVNAHVGGVQASSLIAARLTNKLHREGLMWAGSGSGGVCSIYPQPLMDKTNYKYQMVYPTPQTSKIAGRCCQPYGRTSVLWGAGKEVPFVGNDFSYQIFKKRDCCASYKPTP